MPEKLIAETTKSSRYWVERVTRENQAKGTPFDLVFFDDEGSYCLHRLPTRIEGVSCFFWSDFVQMWEGRGYYLRHETGRKYHAIILERKG